MKKSTPPTKSQAIIIAIIVVVTVSLVLLAECSPFSLRINNEIEKPSYSMKMPKSFYEDDAISYTAVMTIYMLHSHIVKTK